jgi:hypothetical protein
MGVMEANTYINQEISATIQLPDSMLAAAETHS